MTSKNFIIFCFSSTIMLSISCKKFLDEKPDSKLTTPRNIQDLQSLMEDKRYVNENNSPVTEACSDNYYITDAELQTIKNGNVYVPNAYTWETSNIFQPEINEWVSLYKTIAITNVVLENIDKIEKNQSNISDWKQTKANALFIRSFNYLNAAASWALAYDNSVEKKDLGIPLRVSTDINTMSSRASIKETYDKICDDLLESINLFPIVSNYTSARPNRASAYALLSRTYLYMRNYEKALLYSDSSLKLNSNLIDFNGDPDIVVSGQYHFKRFNKEVLYDAQMNGPTFKLFISKKVDTILYSQFLPSDLRKNLSFVALGINQYRFTGNYSGSIYPYCGLAVDEMYLNRAECHARLGNIDLAMKDLNALLIKRYKKSDFIPITASNALDALNIILIERRKELINRGIRFMDIKRLNKEGRGIELRRIVNGKVIILEPNSPKYALPIPEDIIQLTGMPQN